MGWFYNGIEFKVGEEVKVVRSSPSHDPFGMGSAGRWENTWAYGMYDIVGKTGVIEAIRYDGVEISGGGGFCFPLSSLEKIVKDVAPKNPVEFELLQMVETRNGDRWLVLPSGQSDYGSLIGVSINGYDFINLFTKATNTKPNSSIYQGYEIVRVHGKSEFNGGLLSLDSCSRELIWEEEEITENDDEGIEDDPRIAFFQTHIDAVQENVDSLRKGLEDLKQSIQGG